MSERQGHALAQDLKALANAKRTREKISFVCVGKKAYLKVPFVSSSVWSVSFSFLTFKVKF